MGIRPKNILSLLVVSWSVIVSQTRVALLSVSTTVGYHRLSRWSSHLLSISPTIGHTGCANTYKHTPLRRLVYIEPPMPHSSILPKVIVAETIWYVTSNFVGGGWYLTSVCSRLISDYATVAAFGTS